MSKYNDIPEDWMALYEKSKADLMERRYIDYFTEELAYLEVLQRIDGEKIFGREAVMEAPAYHFLDGHLLRIQLGINPALVPAHLRDSAGAQSVSLLQ